MYSRKNEFLKKFFLHVLVLCRGVSACFGYFDHVFLFKCRFGCFSAGFGVLSAGVGVLSAGFGVLRKKKIKLSRKGSPSCAINNDKT